MYQDINTISTCAGAIVAIDHRRGDHQAMFPLIFPYERSFKHELGKLKKKLNMGICFYRINALVGRDNRFSDLW